jgi:hypothetical protein
MTDKKLTKVFNEIQTKVNNLTDEQADIFFDKMDESWESAAKYLDVSIKDFEIWMFCD